MKNFFFPVLLLFTIKTTAQNTPDATRYEACCGSQPVEFSYDKKKVFIPNVFTPNKDGLNDFFAPHVNDVITDIWWFTIYSAEGDTVLYQTMYLDKTKKEGEQNSGWDGLRPDGSVYKGLFRYTMRIDDRDANKHIVEGTACAVICEPGDKIPEDKSTCFYSSQAGEQGTLNKSGKSGEKGCP
jgi:hypothetical protein